MEKLQIKKNSEVFITKEDRDALDKYKDRIKEHQMISYDEEVSLGKKIRLTKDKEAVKKLVEANLFFVISVAKSYINHGVPIMDLINEGNLGLVEATERFDETKGFKFISYAVFWIRRRMLLALNKKDIVESPVGRLLDANKELDSLREEYEQANFIGLSDADAFSRYSEEIIETNKIKNAKTLISARNAEKPYIPLDAPMLGGEEGSDKSIEEKFEDPNIPAPDEELEVTSRNEVLRDILEKLNTDEQEVLKRYYGLYGQSPSSIEVIAENLDLKPEKVYAIRSNALKKLKKNPKAKMLFNEIVNP